MASTAARLTRCDCFRGGSGEPPTLEVPAPWHKEVLNSIGIDQRPETIVSGAWGAWIGCET
eukprot:6065843-Alexandrium_andersonii.AAC.1